MTHSPPVPPGNMSPYPLHEPVHADPLPRPILAERADVGEARISTSAIVAGIAGLGAVVAAGALYVLRGKHAAAASAANRRRRRTASAA